MIVDKKKQQIQAAQQVGNSFIRKNPLGATQILLLSELNLNLIQMANSLQSADVGQAPALQHMADLLGQMELNQREIIRLLEQKGAKRVEFDIQRDSLDGHIVGVVARRLDD